MTDQPAEPDPTPEAPPAPPGMELVTVGIPPATISGFQPIKKEEVPDDGDATE